MRICVVQAEPFKGTYRAPYTVKSCAWFRSTWFLGAIVALVVMTIAVAVWSQATLESLVSQLVLILSVYISLFLLSDRPLINPVQAVVFWFSWWFCVGPAAVVGFDFLAGRAPDMVAATEIGTESLWIVALGLPLYAIVGRWTLARLERRGIYAKFLMPQHYLYRPRTLLFYWLVGVSVWLALEGLRMAGIQGVTQVNYLGGVRTDIWWIGLLRAVGGISSFATVGIMVSLSAPRKATPLWLKVVAVAVVLQTIAGALTGGWKSAFIVLFLYFVCARVSMTQRPPWRLVLLLALGFLVFVEPFVSYARVQAEIAGAQTSSDREAIFRSVLREGMPVRLTDWRGINVSSLFRGIYPLAGELSRRNSMLEGEWGGKTIEWGLQVIVPRALSPDKPDQNIGNFFARTVGADIGVSGAENYTNSVAISIPFEFVGNYGWAAGILSFGLIGLFWALFCGWLLSAPRISSHPLSPFLIGLAMGIELPLGGLLASLRDLAIPVVVALIIGVLLGRRL